MGVLIWLILACMCGFFGRERQCGFGWAFFWGLICPLIGFIYVALSKRKKTAVEALNELEVLRNNGMIDAITYSQAKLDIQTGVVKPISSYTKNSPLHHNQEESNTEKYTRIVCISFLVVVIILAFIYS